MADEESQLEWREKLAKAGYNSTPVMDRMYFKSVYLRDPDGHIAEIATVGPGFAIDEPEAKLGQVLMLPPWLERQRQMIEEHLNPITVPDWQPLEVPTP